MVNLQILTLNNNQLTLNTMKNYPEIRQVAEVKRTELYTNCGLFFAFSNEQFTENKTPLKEGEKYVSIGAGGYLPNFFFSIWQKV